MYVLILILFTKFIVLAYFYLRMRYKHWENRNVPGPRPRFFVGNLGEYLLMKRHIGEIITNIYNEYHDLPFVGMYKFLTPVLLIRDLDLIKDVTVKEFGHFQDNDIEIDENVDPMFGKHPFALKGNRWKHVRGQLSPCFSSGKIKGMFPLMKQVGENFATYIEKQIKTSQKDGFEVRELTAKFTTDNVASCAFGLEGHSFDRETSQFREISRRIIVPDFWGNVKLFVVFLIPALNKILRLRSVPKDIQNEVVDIVTSTLKYRAENNVIRPDFLHIMNQHRENEKDVDFDEVDLAAHALGFIGDGIETSSYVSSFCLLDLAANVEIQKRVRQEINDVVRKNAESLNYDVIQDMVYLNAIIMESMRLHTPVMYAGKLCTENFTYECKQEDLKKLKINIEKNTPIILPTHAIHMNPKYHPNPSVFNPDRFIKENKNDLIPYTYFPFGEGPRACLGQRFGLLQIKVALIYILQNFEVTVNEKMKFPVEYDPMHFITYPKGGIWLNFSSLRKDL